MNLFNTNKENKTDLTKNNIIKFYIANGNSTIYDLSQELNLSVPTTTKLVNESVLMATFVNMESWKPVRDGAPISMASTPIRVISWV